MDFKFFCYICKEHIPVSAKDEKDARKEFARSGHDGVKTAQLARGPIGKVGEMHRNPRRDDNQ